MRLSIKHLLPLLLALTLPLSDAKGGFSSGGGGGGFSSSRPSFSSPARTPSFSSPARTPTYSSPARSATTTTTTTSVSRSYGGRYVGGGMIYGGMGMGYGYSNGLLTGMIIGNMMHPANTVVYTGGGTYNNNALMYPDGRVVSQQGQLLGNYNNNVFTPINNGPIVAQPVPQDAVQQPSQVIIQKEDHTYQIVYAIILGFFLLVILVILL